MCAQHRPTKEFENDKRIHRLFHKMESTTTPEFLNYHHLRYFWMVAKEGSLRRAAEKARVSQPSICSQIQQLERALGEELFKQSGRSLVLTDFGQQIFGYAEEIFTLGSEVLRAARNAPTMRSLRLHAGIVDSFPKLMSFEFLRPVLEHSPPVRLTCHEGKLTDLLALLTSHRLDVVLADEPASPSAAGRVFNHELGESGVTFCAGPMLARKLKGRFPKVLHGAPALLPTQNCTLRRDLERWFLEHNVQPLLVGEFEDAALAKIVATEGHGFLALPTAAAADAVERYGFVRLGRTNDVSTKFYAITAERRVAHPAILAITSRGKSR
jgi:LysR family transcriptional activator of nhaA